MKRARRHNGLIQTMLEITGNQRACLWTEPLWGIPYNLYVPFVSVYMAALGVSPMQIGLINTLFLISQLVWALLSGVLTDKLGRRLTTFLFDLVCWSVPTLLWMLAQDVRWFAVAVLFNGAWRVTDTAWGLLLIEDVGEDKLVHLYSMMQIAGLLAGFFAPIAYVFVQRYGMVPTVRVLYGLAFVMMTSKFVILFLTTRETTVGLRRMQESRGESLLGRLWNSRQVLRQLIYDRRSMITVLLIACFTGFRGINDAFWPLLVTEKLGIAAENLSLFYTVKTLLMLGCYFWIVPRLDLRRFRNPVLTGFVLFAAQEVLMLVMPVGAYWLVMGSVVLQAFALSLLTPLTTSLQMVNIEREERARLLGFFYALCMLITSPLSTIAGALAEWNPAMPFALNLALTLAAVYLTVLLWRMGLPDDECAVAEAPPAP